MLPVPNHRLSKVKFTDQPLKNKNVFLYIGIQKYIFNVSMIRLQESVLKCSIFFKCAPLNTLHKREPQKKSLKISHATNTVFQIKIKLPNSRNSITRLYTKAIKKSFVLWGQVNALIPRPKNDYLGQVIE